MHERPMAVRTIVDVLGGQKEGTPERQECDERRRSRESDAEQPRDYDDRSAARQTGRDAAFRLTADAGSVAAPPYGTPRRQITAEYRQRHDEDCGGDERNRIRCRDSEKR